MELFEIEKVLLSEICQAQKNNPLDYADKLNNFLSLLEDCQIHCSSRLAIIPEIYQLQSRIGNEEITFLSSEFLEDLNRANFGLVDGENLKRHKEKIIQLMNFSLSQIKTNFEFDFFDQKLEIRWESKPRLIWIISFDEQKWPLIRVRTYLSSSDSLKMEVKSWFLAQSLLKYSNQILGFQNALSKND